MGVRNVVWKTNHFSLNPKISLRVANECTSPKQPWEHLSLFPPDCPTVQLHLHHDSHPSHHAKPPLNPRPRQQNRCLVTDRGGEGADYGFAFTMEEVFSVLLSLPLTLHSSISSHPLPSISPTCAPPLSPQS